MKRQVSKPTSLFLNHPELDRYVDIYFEEVKADWFKKEGEGRFTPTRHQAVRCEQEHFGNDEVGKQLYAEW